MTFVLAVLGALANATASFLQRKAAGDEPDVTAGMVLLLRSSCLQREAGRSEGSLGQAAGESSDCG